MGSQCLVPMCFQFLSRIIIGCVLLLELVASNRKDGLSLWIDEKQVATFTGQAIKIYLIKDGVIAPYLTPKMARQLPTIPHQVNTVNLTWEAGNQYFNYWFEKLESTNNRVLYDPLLSIPVSGIIPRETSVFQMAIPCTGLKNGKATLRLSLAIYQKRKTVIDGSPIQIHLNKHCRILYEASLLCKNRCQNGGRCNKYGICECQQGYMGTYCERAMCFPKCKNNGTCIAVGQCLCSFGFTGRYCEKEPCNNACEHGRCVMERDAKYGVCWCEKGYYGDTCQFTDCKEKPCQNGGTCISLNKCECSLGFKGDDCSLAVTCRRSCGVHGDCVHDNVCKCHSGWRGRHCHKKKTKSRKT